MDRERRELIGAFANNVRTSLDLTVEHENIDLASVAEQLGGRIEDIPLEWEFRYDKVTKEADPNFIIWIDHASVFTRQRFSIAHEIGHLLLHMGYKTNASTWKKLQPGDGFHRLPKTYTPIEQDANEFAASFLMPREVFVKVADEESNDEYFFIDKIANRFGVSEDAASYRGKVLELWK